MGNRGMCGALLILVRQLTTLIDSGRHDAISVPEIRQHLREGDLLPWLNSLDQQRFDISIFGSRGIYVLEAREWQDAVDRQFNVSCPEDYGTERRGICLLFAMTVEQLSSEIERAFELYEKRIAQAEQPEGSGSVPPRQH